MRHCRLLTALLVPLLAAGCGGSAGTAEDAGTHEEPPDAGGVVTGTFSIGGTVSGLVGTGLTLRLNDGPPLAVAGDGPFTFADKLATDTAYAVTIGTQPTGPAQVCGVTGGSGTVQAGDITSVQVGCAPAVPAFYAVKGTVANLEGSGLVLQINAGEMVTVEAGATAFAFPTPLEDGSTYAVAVTQQPPGETCTVTGGDGTVTSADVTTLSVECVPNAMVLRLGPLGAPVADGGTPASVAVALQEVAPSPIGGVRTLAASREVSLNYSITYEGALARSSDGRFITYAAYKAPPGTEDVLSSATGAPRVAIKVDATGVETIAVEIPEAVAFSDRQVRSAVTEDGTAFWMSGDGVAAAVPPQEPVSNGGVWYIPAGTGAAPVHVARAPNSSRWLGIYGGQLYVSSAPRPGTVVDPPPPPSPYVGINTVGTGLPTLENETVTRVAGTDNGSPPEEIATEPHGFAFVEADATPGLDVLYVANDTLPTFRGVHVQKYVFDPADSTWNHVGTFAPTFADTALVPVSALGIAAKRLADGTTLVYATTYKDQLVSFRDNGTDAPAVKVMAKAPGSHHFRSVALAPVVK